jgi:hypothetical protein
MMAKNTSIYILFILFFIFSCQEEVKKKTAPVEPEWTQMNLESDFQSIKIFHKYHGWLNLNSEENEDIFDLTIGGLGLTGTIISVTFILQELNGLNFLTTVKSVNSISQTVDFLESSDEKNLTYSWNAIDSTLDLNSFGKGLIFENKIDEKNNLNSYKKIKFISKKRIFPLNLWNNITIKYFNYFFFIYHNYIKKNLYRESRRMSNTQKKKTGI